MSTFVNRSPNLFKQVDGNLNGHNFSLFNVAVDELAKLWTSSAAFLPEQVSCRQMGVAVALHTQRGQKVRQTAIALHCFFLQETLTFLFSNGAVIHYYQHLRGRGSGQWNEVSLCRFNLCFNVTWYQKHFALCPGCFLMCSIYYYVYGYGIYWWFCLQ